MADITKQFKIVGVMGGSVCSEEQGRAAYLTGRAIADQGTVLLCGGGLGTMTESARGAFEKGGLTIGILPGYDKQMANPYIKIALPTNMGDARNSINILSSDVVVAIGGQSGTLSEIAFAIKAGKQVLAYDSCRPVFSGNKTPELFTEFKTVEELIEELKRMVG